MAEQPNKPAGRKRGRPPKAEQPNKPPGRKRGRPPWSAEMRELMTANATTIRTHLPNIRLRAHDLLRLVYTDPRQPLPIRLQAAVAALPVENRGLAAAEILDEQRRVQVAKRIVEEDAQRQAARDKQRAINEAAADRRAAPSTEPVAWTWPNRHRRPWRIADRNDAASPGDHGHNSHPHAPPPAAEPPDLAALLGE